jgi:ABC-type transport system substrate-binding protein
VRSRFMHMRSLPVSLVIWLGILALCPQRELLGATRRPYGGVLKVPVTGVVETVDPVFLSTPTELEMARQVHDTLYRRSADGAWQPVLAQDLPQVSRGGRELIVRLRPGARFHDGSFITSADVLASWRRLLHPDTASPHWWLLVPIEGALAFHRGKSTKISGLERINRLTFRIRLRAPLPEFAGVLAAVPVAPLPMKWLVGKEQGAYPPGSGPFVWSTDASGGEEMALEAFLGHSRGRPYLDRIAYLLYPSPRAAGLAFELEEVHTSRIRPSRRSGFYHGVEAPCVQMVFLALNPERIEKLPSGFQKAVEQAVDRQALVDYLVGDQGVATDEMVIHKMPEGPQKLLRGDPREARKYFKRVMLQEKGVPPVLEFLVRENQALEKAVAERIQVNLVDIGVVVSVIQLDGKTFADRIKAGQYDFYLAHPLPLAIDPETQLLGLVATVLGAEGVEDLLRSLDRLPVDGNRTAMVRELARRYQVRFPWIPVFQYARQMFVHGSVQGLVQDATGLMNFARAWLVD